MLNVNTTEKNGSFSAFNPSICFLKTNSSCAPHLLFNCFFSKLFLSIIFELLFYFSQNVALARSKGINDLVIDPGIGFAKTIEQNFEVLNNLDFFQMLNLPILLGVSRKSMIYKTLESSAELALNGTTVLNTIGLQKGANILRVHDVKEAIETIKLVGKL